MPSVYAHLLMGDKVLRRLSPEMRDRLLSEKKLFYMGLLGPDILFFYRPTGVNSFNRMGSRIHSREGLEIIGKASSALSGNDSDDSKFAYICGLICHFALDRRCHGYIRRRTEKLLVPHAGTELLFDMRLFVRCGRRRAVLRRLDPDLRSARVVSGFYEGTDTARIFSAMRNVRRFCKLFAAIAERRHVDNSFKGSDRVLLSLLRSAASDAVMLISELEDSAAGLKSWNRIYRYTFASDILSDDNHDRV